MSVLTLLFQDNANNLRLAIKSIEPIKLIEPIYRKSEPIKKAEFNEIYSLGWLNDALPLLLIGAPLLDALYCWFKDLLTRVSPKSELAVTIRYAISRWKVLTRFIAHGTVEIDNNTGRTCVARAVDLSPTRHDRCLATTQRIILERPLRGLDHAVDMAMNHDAPTVEINKRE